MADNEKYPLALPQGTVLAGQYIIEEVLGQGGFGITYRATDHKSGQNVAVKEFFPDSMATRTQTTVTAFSGERGESFEYGKGCFLQEAETLAEFIGNENIVRVHSYFEENGTAYFVMDFVEGESFDHYIREHGGRVSYEEAEKILVPVMNALSAVHSRGIVHRDVTPDNIYITKDGTVKLLDFGAARYSLGDKSRSLDVVLKHGFAPKEQYTRHGKQGPFTDVYTLGASFYYAITGRRPPDSIDRIEEDELVPPSSLGASLSADQEDAILTAMSVQPQNRFQTMEAFKNALMGNRKEAAGQGAGQPVQQRIFTGPTQQQIPPSQGQYGQQQIPPSQGQYGQQQVPPSQGQYGQQQPQYSYGQPGQQQIPPSQGQYSQQQVPPSQGQYGQQQPQYSYGQPQQTQGQQQPKQKKKWLLPACIGGGAVAVVAVIAIAVSLAGGSSDEKVSANYEVDNGNGGTISGGNAGNAGTTSGETAYDTYQNNVACFSVDYPQGYQTSEPADTNVLFVDGTGTDFQVSVEYNYCTPGNVAIYSAEDFDNQVTAWAEAGYGYKMIDDWIGTSCDVTNTEELFDAMGGRHCYRYSFSFEMDSKPYGGQLYVCDGDGDFGCYTLLWVVNEQSEKADLYKSQCQAMVDSFQLTGKYQPEGMEVHHYSDIDDTDVEITFLTGEGFGGETEDGGYSVYVYPVASVWSEANCYIDPGWDLANAETALESMNTYYMDYKDNPEWTSEPTPITYGRYTYTVATMEYDDSDEHFKHWAVVFPYKDIYWQIEGSATAEYEDVVVDTLGNILFSLKLDDGISVNEHAAADSSSQE